MTENTNNPYEATLVVNDNVHAAMKRAARNPKTAGVTIGFWLERHNSGDTGNGMWWDAARVQRLNRLEGLPFYSQWQLNRNNLVRIRTANGVTTVSLISGQRR
jgi:hypothetical protein